MAWLALLLAGLLEVAWASGLPLTEGFTKPLPSLGVALALAGSMWLLALATRTLPIGTAYPIWVGIGALGTVATGVLFFREPLGAARALFALLLVVAIVGLKLSAPTGGDH